jgi:hypothetical protein
VAGRGPQTRHLAPGTQAKYLLLLAKDPFECRYPRSWEVAVKHPTRVLVALAAVVAIGACTEYPTRPANRRPTISSITVFPQTLGPGDSTIVTVTASDPDGDTLLYDWFTDGRLILKNGSEPYLYHTTSNSQVFYRSTTTPYADTAWIACSAHDGKGGGSLDWTVRIVLRDTP